MAHITGNAYDDMAYRYAYEYAEVIDANEHTGVEVYLVEFGDPRRWPPEHRERFEGLVFVWDIQKAERFRWVMVVKLGDGRIVATHFTRRDHAAGVFDDAAGRHGCDGHAMGYRAKG